MVSTKGHYGFSEIGAEGAAKLGLGEHTRMFFQMSQVISNIKNRKKLWQCSLQFHSVLACPGTSRCGRPDLASGVYGVIEKCSKLKTCGLAGIVKLGPNCCFLCKTSMNK